jgi:hypothetical protein
VPLGGFASSANFTVDLTDGSIPRLFNRRYYENDYLSDFSGTTGASNLLISVAGRIFW